MKSIGCLICYVFIFISCEAQNLPSEKLLDHLVNSEGMYRSNYEEMIKIMYVEKLCGDDTVAIYRFNVNSSHGYIYLLLKDGTKYKILNCDNFYEEWKLVEEILIKIKDLDYNIAFALIHFYIRNYNFHPTPAIISLDDPTKIRYLPRKVIETNIFYWK